MTCLVGIEHKGRVVLGCDSFVGSNVYADETAIPKIIERRGWLVGISGGIRVQGMLAHVFDWPAAPSRHVDRAVVRLADSMAPVLMKHDLSVNQANDGRSVAIELLIGVAGRLYQIGSSLGVCRSRRGYNAAGCGDQYALGSLATTKGEEPETRVLRALRASAAHHPQVSGPFRVVWSTP